MAQNFNQLIGRALGVDGNKVAKDSIRVTTSTTELWLADSPGIFRIWLKNGGATATNSCKIQGRNSTDAAWVDVVATATDFTTIPAAIAGFLLISDDTITPTALTAGQEWNGVIESRYSQTRMIATTGSGQTSIAVEVG